jgi:hypothetical protein
MRWIDISLTGPDSRPEWESMLDEATACANEMPELQKCNGLDSPVIVRRMAEVGQMLFHAITQTDPSVFQPRREHEGGITPHVGVAEADYATGYHIIAPPRYVGLPWTWLHNGLSFLLEQYTICCATSGSRLPAAPDVAPWMTRLREANLTQQIQGEQPLRSTLPRLRPEMCADPEILFVPGHCEDEIRRLIYREADGIKRALAAGSLGRPLARLSVLTEAVTPALLTRRSALYQGLHFAGPTAQSRALTQDAEASWLVELVERINREAGDPAEDDIPVDLELEVVGIDPITALLDHVTAKAEMGGGSILPPMESQSATTTLERSWWLDDGPVQPEELGENGGIPPLVFSNSYRSLPELSHRFLAAGGAAFIGPHVPLYSRPARKFAGRFYNFLADGHCVATALRTAALACRSQFGADHPVWLSYGVAGYGSLALQYL